MFVFNSQIKFCITNCTAKTTITITIRTITITIKKIVITTTTKCSQGSKSSRALAHTTEMAHFPAVSAFLVFGPTFTQVVWLKFLTASRAGVLRLGIYRVA